MERGTILVVDDEANIADLVRLYLERDGFRVEVAATGEAAIAAHEQTRPRLIVLDIGLPDIDGVEVCRRVRASSDVPIVFLTARDSEVDRVVGLELGADDYVVKPFSAPELVARIKAVLRRSGPPVSASVLHLGALTVDLTRREVLVDGAVLECTAKEFDLLQFFAERPGRALSRRQILEGVWGADWYGDIRTIDVHVAQLRRKLGPAFDLRTVRGLGYRLEVAR
jgi:DNA-binding response OmpR family regulator